MPGSHSSDSAELFPNSTPAPPDDYLIAHVDGGSRGNPGPAGYGVVISDRHGRKVATLSEYLGHQTNNYAEYHGLLAALDYAVQHGHRALKVVGDSELLVKQIRGVYRVKSPALQELYQRAKEMIGKLDWFSIQHVLREGNHEADRLANLAMDKGMGRTGGAPRQPEATRRPTSTPGGPRASSELAGQELSGVVRGGVVVLENASLPDGTRVQVRVRK